MNTSYLSSSETISISTMINSFVESDTNQSSETCLDLTEDLLKQLFHENYSFFCHSAMKIVDDEEAAKDIVQDFFLYCWERKASIRIQGKFENYAYRAIRNASLNYQKRLKKVDYNSDLIRDAAEVLVHSSDADYKQGQEQREQALWRVIDLMPDKRKQVFLLSQSEGLTYLQIAETLDISINTVKTHIKLAYVFLRKECQWFVMVLGWLFFIK